MAEKCVNHPKIDAEGKCSLCGKLLCDECLVRLQRRILCRRCLDVELSFEESKSRQTTKKSMKTIGIGCSLAVLIFFVVIAVSLLLPYFKTSKISACHKNLKKIYKIMVLYSQDYGGKLPPEDNDLTPLFMWGGPKVDLELFVCPATKNIIRSVSDLKDSNIVPIGPGSSYFYRGGLSMQLQSRRRERVPLLWDQSMGNHGKYVNVLYLNSDIEDVTKNLPELQQR